MLKKYLSYPVLLVVLSFVTHQTFGGVTLNISVTNVTGNSSNDSKLLYNGSFTITASGGAAPYGYVITNLPASFSVINSNNNGYFANLPAFVYQVSVFDVNKIKIADTSVTVTSVYPVPTVYCYLQMPTSCDSSNGRIVFSGQGGTLPYTYSIDGGVTFTSNDTFTNLATGYYNCILKDANGMLALFTTSRCYRGCTGIPGIIDPPYFGPSAFCTFISTAYVSSVSTCNNSGIINIFANSLPPPFVCYPPYYYSMDGVNYLPANTTPFENVFEDSLAPGLYKIYFKDSIGQQQVFSISLAKFCAVQINNIVIDASCQQSDGGITVLSTGGRSPYNFTMDGINFQASNTFSNLAAGTYSFSVRDADGNISTAVATIYNKCPEIFVTGTNETCGQKNGTISAAGIKGTRPYHFSIDGVNFQTDSSFKNLSEGFYKVILKDANDFTDSSLVTIINNCLKVTTTTTNETCDRNDAIIAATATGGSQPYIYSIDGINFQSGNSFAGLAKGQYTITVKDAAGATSTVKDTILNKAGPSISLSPSNAGCDGTNGSITISVTGGTAPFQYSLDSINYQSSNVLSNRNEGQYRVIIKDSNNCIATDTITVFKNPTPVVSIGNDTSVCVGQTVLINAPAGAQYEYQWQDNSTTNNYTVIRTGQYWVKVTNQFNCAVTDTINIVFKPLPVFSLGNDTSICIGKSLNLAVTLTGATYLWNTGSTSSSLAINGPGLYWLKVSDGCTKTDSIVVTYKPSPIVNLGKDSTLCEGQNLQLNAGNPGTTYLWQDNSTAANYQVSKEGLYFVSVNKAGCFVSDTINVAYKLKPRFTLGPDQLICHGQVITLQPSNNENWQLRWQDGSNKSSIQVTQPGLYGLIATNTCGTNSDEVLFTKGLCKVYVPNAFTPNGDTRNDVFKVSGTDMITEFHLQIFNRYGQIVFDTQDKNKGWDGNFNNKPAVNGNYVYLLQYKEFGSAQTQVQRGSCMLIR